MKQCWHYWSRKQLAPLLLSRRDITTNGCWVYTRHRNLDGYGRLRVAGKYYGVHVVAAWVWLNYRIAPERRTRVVRHLCNNPGCFNPAHLAPGSQKQNVADAFKQGTRKRTGEQTHCRKGHPMVGDNVGWCRGFAQCRTCAARRGREGRARMRFARKKGMDI